MPFYIAAALRGLYSPLPPDKMSYRHLTPLDMKLMVEIFRGVPFPSTPSTEQKYARTVKHLINNLPSHLRSSRPSTHANLDKDGKVRHRHLCDLHAGLSNTLIYSTWGWIRHELDGAIGRFTYPVIMFGGLTQRQERMARQLEPVVEMYHRDFTIAGSTPPDHEPVVSGYTAVDGKYVSKFGFQANKCPACILARLGSDADVLVALYAGMVARIPSRHLGSKHDVKSKRVKFVQKWLKAFDGGRKLVDEAWDLGKEMRRIKHAWGAHAKLVAAAFPDVQGARPESPGQITVPSQPYTTPGLLEGSILIGLDIGSSSLLRPTTNTATITATNPATHLPPPPTRIPSVSDEQDKHDRHPIDSPAPLIPASSTYEANPPPLLPPTTFRPTSSIYSRTTSGHIITRSPARCGAYSYHSPNTSPGPHIRTILAPQTALALPSEPSIHSESCTYSIASSFDSNSTISWNCMPPTPGDASSRANEKGEKDDVEEVLLCAPLRVVDKPREKATGEWVPLPLPNRGSVYAGFGIADFKIEDGGGWEGGEGMSGSPVCGVGAAPEGIVYELGPEEGLGLKPRSQMTVWSQLY